MDGEEEREKVKKSGITAKEASARPPHASVRQGVSGHFLLSPAMKIYAQKKRSVCVYAARDDVSSWTRYILSPMLIPSSRVFMLAENYNPA